MDALIFSVVFAVAVALVFLAAAAADRKIAVAFALLGAVYLGLDDLVTGLASEFISLPGLNWNWTGKVFSLLLSALVIAALRLSPEAVGLTLKQDHKKIGIAAVLLFVVWGTCLGLLFKPGQADLETLAFQATMPGISEELVYRGICPAILLGLIHRRRGPVGGTPWAVILATAIVFGIWHGLGYSGGDFRWDTMSALIPFVGSIAGGWLRFKTGSLLVPVLGHAVANVAFHVAGGLVA